MIQAQTRGQVLEGVQQYGLAPGARKMIDAEEQAAQMAMDTGIYAVWRSSKGGDCTRIGPTARCFCNHSYAEHFFVSPKAPYPICKGCSCRAFAFVPSRPEEVGEWWLPRRKGFNVHTWRAKCRCGHGHDEHDPNARRCRCGCSMFQSNFACLACDLKWEDHETVFETATERLMAGRPVGEDFRPLADDAAIRDLVFPGEHGAAAVDSFAPNSLRRAQVPVNRGEKAVRIMAASSGGAVADQPLANRWGKVANPPAWPPALAPAESPRGPALAGPVRGGGAGPAAAARPMSRDRGRPAGGMSSASSSGYGGVGGGVGRPGSSSSNAAAGGAVATRPGSVGRRPGAGLGAAPGPGTGAGYPARPTVGGVVGGGRGGGSGGGRPAAAVPTSASSAGQQSSGPKQLSSGFRPVYD